MGEKIHAQMKCPCRATAEALYDALLDPASVRLWLAEALKAMGLEGDVVQVAIDPLVGGSFLWSDNRDGSEMRHWGTYSDLVRGQRMEFTWITDPSEEEDPSHVVVTWDSHDAGCDCEIIHTFDAVWADYVERTENAWRCMIEAADRLVSEQGRK